MVIAALGTVFAAAYLLWLYQRTAFGTPPAEFSSEADSHGDHGSHAVPAHSLERGRRPRGGRCRPRR